LPLGNNPVFFLGLLVAGLGYEESQFAFDFDSVVVEQVGDALFLCGGILRIDEVI
jgi:hypothetical protein